MLAPGMTADCVTLPTGSDERRLCNGPGSIKMATKRRHWLQWVLLTLLVLLGLAAMAALLFLRGIGFLRAPVYETDRPRLPLEHHPSVLVFSKTNAFIHKDAIPAAKELLALMGEEQGWGVFQTDGGGVFNRDDLARFDVVVWNNVTGDVLTPAQREAFASWLQSGGGFVGLHAAGDSSHKHWPWYHDTVIRAQFIGHPTNPQFQQATVRIEQPADPIVGTLGPAWQRTDEWYSFAQSPRAPDLRVLATLDEASYVPRGLFGASLAMGADHPVIWKHCAGAGRVFYSALGHTADSYAEPAYREILVRAIRWAGRMNTADRQPADPLPCETS
jgi:type 1 glutamine amidotransferase